jgi:hypothetical protein
MRRRAFITALFGAAWVPFAARAQRSENARRVGVLMSGAADDPDSKERAGALLQGLRDLDGPNSAHGSTSAGRRVMPHVAANRRW